MQNDEIPISDPTPDLAPTAKRILDAGVRVLDEHGFAGLTFERIARESGENGALIRYHFGNKAGLIKAVVDMVLYSEATALLKLITPIPAGEERRQAFSKRRRDVAKHPTAFRQLYDLVPNLLRDPELRPKLRELMRWYRSLDTWAISPADRQGIDDTDLMPLAILSVAVVDGIALQTQADPDLDVDAAFDLWERFVVEHLDELRNGESASGT